MSIVRAATLLAVVVACASGTPPAPPPLANTQTAPAVDAATSRLVVRGLAPPLGDVEGGTYVRILGEGFLADGPQHVKVYFGDREGTVIRFASDTELIVEAPPGTRGQPVDVVLVFDPAGERRLDKAFNYAERASP